MIRRYKIGDAKKIIVQDEQFIEALYGAECFDEIVAYSMVDDKKGKVLAVVGFRVVDGRGEGFAILGKNIGNKMISFFKFVNRLIRAETKKMGVNNVFITVKDSFYEAKRLAKMLGFSEVEKLVKFFNEEDYWLMLRKEW